MEVTVRVFFCEKHRNKVIEKKGLSGDMVDRYFYLDGLDEVCSSTGSGDDFCHRDAVCSAYEVFTLG